MNMMNVTKGHTLNSYGNLECLYIFQLHENKKQIRKEIFFECIRDDFTVTTHKIKLWLSLAEAKYQWGLFQGETG